MPDAASAKAVAGQIRTADIESYQLYTPAVSGISFANVRNGIRIEAAGGQREEMLSRP